jgi:RNA polymerase sigma-70 factor (ECF subfamily)
MGSTGQTVPQTSQSSPEMMLLGRVLAGEKELFYELFKPYERAVYLAALAILQNAADAEEVTQEAALKAFRRLDTFRGESKLSTWLVRIAMNEARMRKRRERRVQYQPLDSSPEDETSEYCPIALADWREIPSEALERKEIQNEIEEALVRLPEKYREVLVLRDIEQLNIAETATVLGVTAGAVKLRLLRARLRMRDLLAPRLRGLEKGRSGFWKGKNPWW